MIWNHLLAFILLIPSVTLFHHTFPGLGVCWPCCLARPPPSNLPRGSGCHIPISPRTVLLMTSSPTLTLPPRTAHDGIFGFRFERQNFLAEQGFEDAGATMHINQPPSPFPTLSHLFRAAAWETLSGLAFKVNDTSPNAISRSYPRIRTRSLAQRKSARVCKGKDARVVGPDGQGCMPYCECHMLYLEGTRAPGPAIAACVMA